MSHTDSDDDDCPPIFLINVLNEDFIEDGYAMEIDEQFSSLMLEYAQKRQLENVGSSDFVFTYKGKTVDSTDTPRSLCMKSEDAIEVHMPSKHKMEDHNEISVQLFYTKDETVWRFPIEYNSSFSNIMKEHASEHGAKVEDFIFSFKGRPFKAENTPKQLRMSEDDVILVEEIKRPENLQLRKRVIRKPKKSQQPTPIILKLVTKFGNKTEIFRETSFDHPIESLLRQFARDLGEPFEKFSFVYKDRTIFEGHSPKLLEMKDYDTIDVILDRNYEKIANEVAIKNFPDRVMIHIIRENAQTVPLSLKYNFPIAKVGKLYAQHFNLLVNRLLRAGRRLHKNDTPISIQLKEGEVIQAFFE
uniref:Rad60-SLD domain-containing protein n=1 Tax=Caenorhabditis tropicalis TaxID=1561998 RepID=A0A1I7TLR5_9PELO